MAASITSSYVRKASLVTHRTIQSYRTFRRSLDPKLSVGFVPTMGALHEGMYVCMSIIANGHLSLVKSAREQNDIVVSSIFVNPTQFGEGEDLDKYPRQLERDTELLTNMGVDHLFAPDKDTMYGKNHVTYVEPEGFDDISEGSSRPGHFRGVATIVTKLFNIMEPTNAYFGQKDAAQCVMIKRMAEDLNFDIQINILPTIRESNGLAMSSRNAYLTTEQREASSILYQSLLASHELYEASFAGQLPLPSTVFQDTIEEALRSEPMISDIQYISIDHKETMLPLVEVGEEGALISIACKVGDVRLIDNIILGR